MIKRTLLLLLFLPAVTCSQHTFFISLNPGISLDNSENKMKAIGEKHIDWFPGISAIYMGGTIAGQEFNVEYNFTSREIEDALVFAHTNPASPEALGSYGSNLVLSIYSIDLSLANKISETIGYSYGPTVSSISRSFIIENLPNTGNEYIPSRFEDRLVSICVGLNMSLNVIAPLNDNGLFFISMLKLRYLHSIWFDARGRNVDNYYQSILFSQLQIGIGQSF